MKKQFRKLFGTLLVFGALSFTAFGVAACGGADGKESSSPSDSTDTLGLDRRIEYVQTNYGEDKASLYTEETYAALQSALQNALTVAGKEDATQSEIDAALQMLNDAISALETLFKPNYTLDELADIVDELKNNYTINVTDYYGTGATKENPLRYKTYYTAEARYNEHINRGYTVYDGYIHKWNYDGENNIVMGRVYFKEGLPSTYLFSDEMSRVNTSLGGLVAADIWGSAGFVNLDGTNMYTTDNQVYFEILTDEILSDYVFEGGLSEAIKSASMEMLEGDVLQFSFYGDTRDEVILSYTVTDIDTTVIEGIKEYGTENPTYTSSGYNGKSYLSDWDTDYSYINGYYSAEFSVYTREEGLGEDIPVYTVYSSYDTSSNGYRYWYTDLGRGFVEISGTTKTFTMENGDVVTGADAAFGMSDLDFGKFIVQNYAEFKLREKTDEYYYEGELTDSLRNFLMRFFALDENSDLKSSEINALSVSKNEEGRLSVTLWNTYSDSRHSDRDGMIIRAVVKGKDSTSLECVENYIEKTKTLDALKVILESAKEYVGGNYTEESLGVLNAAIANAESVLADENRTGEDISAANAALDSAINGLKAYATMQSVAELNNAVFRASFYEAKGYTSDSYAALTAAVSEANALIADGKYTDDQLKEKQTAVENAIVGLVAVGDKDALNALIAEAKALSVENKTANSKAGLSEAILTAETLAAQETVSLESFESAMASLREAMAGLSNLASAENNNALQALYDEVKDTVNDGAYTEESFSAFDEIRAAAAEALTNGCDDETALALKKALADRRSELESVSFVPSTALADIKTAVNELSKASAFKIVYADGSLATYMIGSVTQYGSTTYKYCYDAAQNEGLIYVEEENLTHEFSIVNGEVVLGSLCKYTTRVNSFIAMSLAQAGFPKIGNYKSMVNEQMDYDTYEDVEYNPLVRIGNGNVYYGSYSDYVKITPKLADAVSFTVELVDGKAVIKAYAGNGLNPGISSFDSSLLIATIEAAAADSASAEILDAFLNEDCTEAARISTEEVAAVFEKIGNNYSVCDVLFGSTIVMTEKYFYNGKEGYAFIDGSVKHIYNVNGTVKVGGDVYIGEEKAVSVAQAVEGLGVLKGKGADSLKVFYDDWWEVYLSYYALVGSDGAFDAETAEKIMALLGITYEDEAPVIRFTTVDGGALCITVWESESSTRPENCYIVTFGGAENAELEALVNA